MFQPDYYQPVLVEVGTIATVNVVRTGGALITVCVTYRYHDSGGPLRVMTGGVLSGTIISILMIWTAL